VTPDEIKEVCTFCRRAEFERLGTAKQIARKQAVPAKQDHNKTNQVIFSGSELLHPLLNALAPLHRCLHKAAAFAGRIARQCRAITVNESRSIDSKSFSTPS
jgi:hypothetical protein